MRRGNIPKTRNSAFVVYEDIYDAKNAVDHLNGFNVAGKYLICLYYQRAKIATVTAEQQEAKKQENQKIRSGLS